MKIEPFKLERFFDRYEFEVDRQISASDCSTLTVRELLELDRPAYGPDALRRLGELTLGYTESKGDPVLRSGIAGLYTTVESENVLVAAPEEAIFLLLQAHLEEGDHVVSMSPSYQSLLSVPRAIGCEVDEWPVELTSGRQAGAPSWSFDLERLKGLLRENTKMVIINVPHNPTGCCMTAEEKRELAGVLRARGIMLLADEMYWRLEYDGRADATPFCDLYEKTVSLSGLSKSYGLPGLRIGWLASQDGSLVEPAAQLKDYTTICTAAPSEFLARIAVKETETLVARSLSIVRENLGILEEMCARHADRLELIPGRGGSIVFPRFVDGTSAADFSQALIDRRNLLMLPGDLFDMSPEFFRVGLGRADLREALAVVEEEL